MVRLGPGVRPVSGRVLFLGFLQVSRGSAAVEHGPHVGVRLFVWRDAVEPLFPERIAYTVPYRLSDAEAHLYTAVTDYVREEFNRAEALANVKRAGTVGFALTILQRRLASSPEAIYQSLRRRRERLESRLRELEVLQRGGQPSPVIAFTAPELDADDVEDLDDAPEQGVEAAEARILDQATAARSIGGNDTPRVRYVRRPFQREPDFGAASVNYALKDLLATAEDPRQGGRQVPTGCA